MMFRVGVIPCAFVRRVALKRCGGIRCFSAGWFAVVLVLGMIIGPSDWSFAQGISCPTVDSTQNSHPCAYIANSGAGTVSVINTSTQAVITTISLPTGFNGSTSFPVGLAITPNNATVYVLDDNLNANQLYTVHAISTNTNSITASIELAGAPNAAAITPDGKTVYMAEGNLNAELSPFIEIIDTSTNTVVGTVTGDGTNINNPVSLAISQDGKFAYVADTCSTATGSPFACLDVIDTSTNQAKQITDLTSASAYTPAALVLSPDGSLAYVASHEPALADASITVVAVPSGAISNTFDVTPANTSTATSIVITPDGGRTYAAWRLDPKQLPFTSIFNVTYNPNQASAVPLGGSASGPAALAISHDGSIVYVADNDSNTVTLISTANNQVANTIFVGANPDAVALQPNQPPACSVSVTGGSGHAPLTISATAGCTDPENDITVTTINWGDKTTTSGTTGSHTYQVPGMYAVTATSTDSTGQIGTSPPQAVVVTAPIPPTCTTTGGAPLVQAGSVTLNVVAIGTCTGSQPISRTTIDWGDGSTSPGSSGTHTYVVAGVYTVTLTVVDSLGLVGSVSETVVLVGPAPSVFSGQSSSTTLSFNSPIGLTGPAQINFRCVSVSGTNITGTESPDKIGVGCVFTPPSATLVPSGSPVSVQLTITTTAAASGHLTAPFRHLEQFYAVWLGLPTVLLLATRGSGSNRKKPTRCVALILINYLIAVMVGCGGGFTRAPAISGKTQISTPAGTYFLTVVDVSTMSPPTTGFVQTSLIVPLTVTTP